MLPDFAMLPPEVNSARMYAGVGSGPMAAAATAWDALAAQWESLAGGYASALTTLGDHAWSGPASRAMASAATAYLQWAKVTAADAMQAGGQLRAAAAAYETAFVMTVPPPVIAENRALLAMLVATNFFGQNIPAIAATEVAYAEMWAQDAVAMHAYATVAVPAATTLAAFTPAPRTTRDDRPAGQQAAVAHAASQAAQTLTHTAATMPGQPHSVVAPPHSGPTGHPVLTHGAATHGSPVGTSTSDGMIYIHDWKSFEQVFKPFWGIQNENANLAVTVNDDGDAAGYIALTPRKALLPEPALGLLGGKDPFLSGHVQPTSLTASSGHAATVGQLSVPRNWATLAKAVSRPGFAIAPPSPPVDMGTVAGAEPGAGAEAGAGVRQPPPALTPLQYPESRYTGNNAYRSQENRNFRMPRPAVGG